MMVTPTDFSLITGLEFSSVPLPFDSGIDVFSPEVKELLGSIVIRARAEVESTQLSARGIRRSTLATAFDDGATTREQQVHIFALILLSGTFSPDKGSRALLYYLPAVRNLHRIGTYDLASLAYADFIRALRDSCRHQSFAGNIALSGFLEGRRDLVLRVLPLSCAGKSSLCRLPVSASWGSCRVGMSTAYVRDWIISEPEVMYRPWVDLAVPGLAAQYSAERRYFLGTYGAASYLRERVAI